MHTCTWACQDPVSLRMRSASFTSGLALVRPQARAGGLDLGVSGLWYAHDAAQVTTSLGLRFFICLRDMEFWLWDPKISPQLLVFLLRKSSSLSCAPLQASMIHSTCRSYGCMYSCILLSALSVTRHYILEGFSWSYLSNIRWPPGFLMIALHGAHPARWSLHLASTNELKSTKILRCAQSCLCFLLTMLRSHSTLAEGRHGGAQL